MKFKTKTYLKIGSEAIIIHVFHCSQVMKDPADSQKQGPEDGCYITGLYIEGARWDMDKFNLVESRPKELFTTMPYFWLVPAAHRKAPTSGIYECPVYKTLTRAGMSYLSS